MNHTLLGAVLFGVLLLPSAAWAWDGFDADTSDLVEMTPDKLPAPGEAVDVREYDADTAQTCLVERVARNSRTVEVVVRTPDGKRRTLVMEGR